MRTEQKRRASQQNVIRRLARQQKEAPRRYMPAWTHAHHCVHGVMFADALSRMKHAHSAEERLTLYDEGNCGSVPKRASSRYFTAVWQMWTAKSAPVAPCVSVCTNTLSERERTQDRAGDGFASFETGNETIVGKKGERFGEKSPLEVLTFYCVDPVHATDLNCTYERVGVRGKGGHTC